MRKHWLQDVFYFVTLDFSLYNEPRRELIELYLRKKSVALRNFGFICCGAIQSIALCTHV